ncbi:hypothetical protein V5O48_018867, partial [Marasmius crinis-equi]
ALAAQEEANKENTRLKDQLDAIREGRNDGGGEKINDGDSENDSQSGTGDGNTPDDAGRQVTQPHATVANGSAAPSESDFGRRRQALETLAAQRSNNQEPPQNPVPQDPTASSTGIGPSDTKPRPPGRPGQDYNLCMEMGLSRSRAGIKQYNMLIRVAHHALHESRIPWQKFEWNRLPSDDKSIMYGIMRQRAPFLAKFENNWASEWLVRQYIKTLRADAYKNKIMERPSKYDHLVANSSRRNQAKPRKSKARQDYENRKERAKEKKRAEREERRKKRRISRRVEESDDEDGGTGDDGKESSGVQMAGPIRGADEGGNGMDDDGEE